jgi:hypothetical protein
MGGPSCAHVFFEFLYAKGMLNEKTCECKNLYLFFIIFCMLPWYGVHGALKNAKSRK